MLKKHSQIFQSILFLTDAILIALSWVLAYFLRFYFGPIPVLKGIPSIKEFLSLLFILLPVCLVIFKYSGLYEPMRSNARASEIQKIFSASILSTLVFITIIYLTREYKYSRVVFLYFLVINIISLSLFRYNLRILLGWFRKRGFNLRYALIAGDGKLAQEVERKLIDHVEYGFKVIGFLSKDEESVGKKIDGIPILGTYKDVKTILEKTAIDQLILALPFEHLRLIRPILGQVYDEMVEVKIVPDIYQYFTLRQGIEILDGLPIISLRESPLYGWNRLLKRFFDIALSITILFLTSLPILFIALIVKLSSPGSVFFKQERMGLDGKIFDIIKFRSMRVGAEDRTGPVWATENDARVTRIGSFIRKFNLDELPQFFNVLKGQMSIVGPRPERPEFMQEFKKRIPEYMLRHKMKAGITGWAQVNGLRGNTSLEERTKYDLYYIENWSLLFDAKIFLKSFFATRNAY
jgi:Undecaprenyl-phosphate glucose phosphotransferase